MVPILGYGLALLLGVPSAGVDLWTITRGRWSPGLRGLLVVAGPLLLIIGMETVPHVVNPCLVAKVGGGELPAYCEQTESGADTTGRFHALHHAVTGAVPMLTLYGWALHRWRPDVLRHRWRIWLALWAPILRPTARWKEIA